jgi:hypothetical protein
MSAVHRTSRYTPNIYREKSAKQNPQNSDQWEPRKSVDRIGYYNQYRSKTSFLDKYRPKTASYYSASKDINNR